MLTYTKGDATSPFHPSNSERKIIPHICNDCGKWGAGFTGAITKRDRKPEQEYRLWYMDGLKQEVPFRLGEIQLVPYCGPDSGLFVCNMVAQSGIGKMKFRHNDKQRDLPPIRYGALAECMLKLVDWINDRDFTLHAPKFGSGLSYGNWAYIEGMIKDMWCDFGELDVTIYEYQN